MSGTLFCCSSACGMFWLLTLKYTKDKVVFIGDTTHENNARGERSAVKIWLQIPVKEQESYSLNIVCEGQEPWLGGDYPISSMGPYKKIYFTCSCSNQNVRTAFNWSKSIFAITSSCGLSSTNVK